MAHFRAVIKGQRSEASRLGNKKTGIKTLLQTWGYDLRVSMQHDEQFGEDRVSIELVPHDGHGVPLCVGTGNLTTGTWQSGNYAYVGLGKVAV